jgi:hypothetical protein
LAENNSKTEVTNTYKKKPILLTKWNKTNIQDLGKLRQYRTSLHNKLKNTPDTNNINEEWERIINNGLSKRSYTNTEQNPKK